MAAEGKTIVNSWNEWDPLKHVIVGVTDGCMIPPPVPFRDAYPFGGGLHCSTTDVYREGTCEDYFPKQGEGV